MLIIDEVLKSNKVVITNNNIKNCLLLLKSKSISNAVIKTYEQFIADFINLNNIAEYVRLGSKYGFYLSDSLLRNSYLINDTLDNEKTKMLKEVHKEKIYYESISLYKNGITILDYYYDNEIFNYILNKISDKVEIEYKYHYSKDVNKVNLLSYKSQKEEVFEMVYTIAKLIHNGKSIDDIYIVVINNEYYNILKEVFSIYQLPYCLNEKVSLYEYKSSRSFIDYLYNNLDKKFDEVCLEYVFYKDKAVNKLTNLINLFIGFNYLVSDIIDGLVYKIRSTFITLESEKGIKVLNDYNYLFNSDDYIFVLGVNQDIIPKVYKDDDFLFDVEKEAFGVITSTMKNKYQKEKFISFISSYENLYLSYSLSSMNRGYVPSSILDDLKGDLEIKTVSSYDIYNSYCQRYSLLKYSKLFDDFNKYNIINDELILLNSSLDVRKFSNNNAVIKKGKLQEKLNKGMMLSYTSITEYYKCPYAFYLNRVLKIKKDFNEESLFVGNLFHDVLYNMLLDNTEYTEKDVEKFIIHYYDSNDKRVDSQSKLFISIYKYYLYSVYKYILKISERTLFKIDSVEQEYHVDLNINGYSLNGKIDKVMSAVIKGKEYVIVLDYKTGLSDIDLNRVIHGYDMQLLFYYYLLNQNNSVEFGGGYLQHVFPRHIIRSEKNKTYNELLESFYKYNGYTNTDISVIACIDKEYDKNTYLEGIKFLKGSNELTANARKKAISSDEYYKLLEIVYKKIDEACINIYNGKFDIAPTYIDSLACDKCIYKEICYYTDDNIVYKEKYKDLSFVKEVANDSKKTE